MIHDVGRGRAPLLDNPQDRSARPGGEPPRRSGTTPGERPHDGGGDRHDDGSDQQPPQRPDHQANDAQHDDESYQDTDDAPHGNPSCSPAPTVPGAAGGTAGHPRRGRLRGRSARRRPDRGIRQHGRVADADPRGEFALRGCLGDAIGEAAVIAALAVLWGGLVLVVRAFDVLLQRNLTLGAGILIVAALAFAYGLPWTIRVGPGLYLEHLRADHGRQQRLGVERRRVRIAGMVYVQVVFALAVGYVVTVLLWGRP